MKPLSPEYQQTLDNIASKLQESAELQQFLDSEEDEDYMGLRTAFEESIAQLYSTIIQDNPLQIIAFEKALVQAELEGLYLPRILGFAVLRGVINENYKYIRPQEHFKEILLAICNSSNFDFIRKRIGQTIQMGFALSSDIWVTNLINEIVNKRIRYFLQNQKLPRYRDPRERKIGYARYKRQFRNENFLSTTFPTNLTELKVLFPSVRQFIHHRTSQSFNNSSFIPDIRAFLHNDAFRNGPEFLELLSLYANFFKLDGDSKEDLKNVLNTARTEIPDFADKWLHLLNDLHTGDLTLDATSDNRVSDLISRDIDDELTEYYDLTNEIHGKGYLNDEVIEKVKVYYNNHQGLSINNDCLRKTIFNYFHRFITNINEREYYEYFELSKIFPSYMGVFNNQQFNQNLKELCMSYVRKLLKKYTDKRGKDYQDIKKFVSSNFRDLKFLKDKEIVELFKTSRKKKTATS
ncbi:MAG: hypothetical protein AAF990_02735 [Bacteroidota bacterium]